MKSIYILPLVILLFSTQSCVKEDVYRQEKYACNLGVDLTANHPMQSKLDNFMKRMMNRGGVGLSVMIKSPDGVCYGSAGMADIATGVKMQPCNRFRIGSLTKIITSAAILRLYDEGKLSLDDQISKYIDKSIIKKIDKADKTTIKMLLNHSSGIPHYLNMGYLLDAFNFSIKSIPAREMLERIYYRNNNGKTLYSNSNYILLGMVMENIEHKPVYDIIREKVIYPLQLKNTFFSDEEPFDLVQAYADVFDNGKFACVSDVDKKLFGNAGYCDGAIISNTEDLLKFYESLSNGVFLKTETFNLMTLFEDIPEDENNKYTKKFGLGLFYYETPYGPAYGHPGGLYGYNAFMCYFPEKKMYFVCLSNSSSLGKVFASKEVFDELFK